MLKKCPVGEWVSTKSLVDYLKTNHPYFFIPKNIPEKDRFGKPVGRYDNFYEKSPNKTERNTVPSNDPDAFERVEGRYVERFLEYIPLTMRLVDLAYSREAYVGSLPAMGTLQAFRINERFVRLMNGEAIPPKVTIQPNFDIVIESDFYPAKILSQVGSLGERVSNNNSGHNAYVGIFQLKKAAVAATLVREPELDIKAMLTNLSGRELPPNVRIELEEWAGHADQFTLYEGFSLLETTENPYSADKFCAETISPTLRLVRAPDQVFTALENQGLVPLRVRHFQDDFILLPEDCTSLFPRDVPETGEKTARPVKLSHVITISYKFPDTESFDAVGKTLAELRCPFHADTENRIIQIQQKEKNKFDEAMEKLAGKFFFEVE